MSVMWYVLTVSQVGAMARFEWNLLSVNIHSKSYKVTKMRRLIGQLVTRLIVTRLGMILGVLDT